jgi:hypothetical protein
MTERPEPGDSTRTLRLRLAAGAAMQRSAELSVAAERTRRESHARRLASRAHLLYARLHGVVDNSDVCAVVRTDGSIAADEALIQRAHLVVALGETFADGLMAASLSRGPLNAALTLTRACDRVTSLEMAMPACCGDKPTGPRAP